MNKSRTHPPKNPIAIWIITGVGMLIVQVILGGITRLTGSGLSITEWDVVTGILPPMNAHQWLVEFQKYQHTPQYRLLNSDFNLVDFKSIFFWEWLHRFWGRLIAVAFAIPFLIFLIQRRFKPEMVRPLLILFFLGALQGAVGWIMVSSGLTGDAIYVKPAKLAMHFVLACLLISYAFWFSLKLTVKKMTLVADNRLKNFTWFLTVVALIQLVFGALMAGYKAAPSAPTWPDINGSFMPASMVQGNMKSWFDHPVSIHFIHRSLAYILVLLILTWTLLAKKIQATPVFKQFRRIPMMLVIVQLLLGIFTVLASAGIRATKWNRFEWLAEAHQVVGIFLFLSLVAALFFIRRKQSLKSNHKLDPEPI